MKGLDLYCKAGGSTMGYHLAGFEMTGVDIEPQPRFPFRFVHADALDYVAEHGHEYDFIAASPPCQAYSITRHTHSVEHPDLLDATRNALRATGKPYVIENVVGAPMPSAIVLCGAAFNLNAYDPATGLTLWLRRHRQFESNVPLWGPGGCFCAGKEIGGVYGGGSSDRNHAREVRRGGYTPANEVRRELMGIDWMTQDQLSQAIPPAYTEFLGAQVLEWLRSDHAVEFGPFSDVPVGGVVEQRDGGGAHGVEVGGVGDLDSDGEFHAPNADSRLHAVKGFLK